MHWRKLHVLKTLQVYDSHSLVVKIQSILISLTWEINKVRLSPASTYCKSNRKLRLAEWWGMGMRLPCAHLMSLIFWWMLPGLSCYWESQSRSKTTSSWYGILTLLNSFMFVESCGVPKRPIWLITVVSSPPWLSWINSCRGASHVTVMWWSHDTVGWSWFKHHSLPVWRQHPRCHLPWWQVTLEKDNANWGGSILCHCWKTA